MKSFVSSLLTLSVFISCNAQNGQNIQPFQSGKQIVYAPEVYVRQLPRIILENSSLLSYDDLFWTATDSGGEAKIYGYNRDGEIVREVEIANATNGDWEALTQDDDYIYIGDFGNNNGTRRDLKVYKVIKDEVKNSSIATAVAIEFTYANQDRIRLAPRSHPFDGEAIANRGDNLFIFTKDWVNETTTAYKVPKQEGSYNLQPLESLDIGALVTGADISPDESTLALISYHDLNPKLHLFRGISSDNIFGEEYIYVGLDSIAGAQTEGISFLGNDTLLISCERTRSHVQQVFIVNLAEILNDGTY